MSSLTQSKISERDSNESSGVKYTPTTEFITVPSFLLKTYEIVDDPAYDDIVSWNKAGDAFVIYKTNEFCEKILPMYFKHKNLSSFVRQLNMYGFHKTKYKNNEQCFTHKFFRKDNKKLLLQMKRKTKEKSSDKKTSNSDPYVKSSDFLKVMNEMRTKIKDQEKKINQLIKVNKEFKNSVLTLYTELEKSKERERNVEKVLIDLSPMFQKGSSNKILEDQLPESLKDKMADNKVRLDNNDMMNLFKAFVENLVQNINNKRSNVYYDNSGNFNYFGDRDPSPSSRQIVPFEGNHNGNFMIENGPLSPRDSLRDYKDSSFGSAAKRRNRKAMRSPSPVHNDAWRKVHEISDRDRRPSINFADTNAKSWEKDHLFDRDHSVISDYDHLKDDKIMDNVSVLSNNPLNDILANEDKHNNVPIPLGHVDQVGFDGISQQSKDDMLDLNSVSSFTSGSKFAGKKRRALH